MEILGNFSLFQKPKAKTNNFKIKFSYIHDKLNKITSFMAHQHLSQDKTSKTTQHTSLYIHRQLLKEINLKHPSSSTLYIKLTKKTQEEIQLHD